MELINSFGFHPNDLPILTKSKSHETELINSLSLQRASSDQDHPQAPFQIKPHTSEPDIPQEHFDTESTIQILQNLPFNTQDFFDPFHISCKICMTKSSDYHRLDCSHTFCIKCLKLYFNNLIDVFKVSPSDLVCPECDSVFSESHFFRYLTFEDSLRIPELRAKKRFMGLMAQGKAIGCPVVDCKGFAHVFEDQDSTACVECNSALCLKCGEMIHPNLDCYENEEDEEDFEFLELMLSEKWKKCPSCGVPVEKIDGCQFLTCTSPVCDGNNYLCNICGKKLSYSVHFGHFISEGVFGTVCNTIEGLTDEEDE